ncbi:serine hydrolase domain-containing protein [Pseudemcibacter aquimaris]|uniref:serine hydrolase domain-containing protein n=1 Tax=Pseudemcibacter aquimaris TaxID=2857064 RepID=UPI002011DC47|nr:serine hydrolase domain-containing protein [Pseudemcibacter aquimaris]MCC3859981.1 beta-lactamase family protein [Pseudemcibacter aquimaris]WDU57313.1 beta-lactamase family protein [Pseudemcibacter aquimaris]
MRHLFIASLCIFTAIIQTNAQTIEQATHLMDTWLDAQKDYNKWPSISVSFVNDQELIYSRSFGGATPDTLYRIASNSKLFTALAILKLRDQGKLNLDDTIEKHIDWYNIKQKFDQSDPITIKSLLTHNSGLPYEPDLPYWSYRDGYPFPSLDELKQGTSKIETLYPVNEKYQYSNLGFILLGQIIESASGVSYHQYVHEQIIEPMGLENTFTNVDASKHGNELAVGYGKLDRKQTRMEVPFIDTKATTSAAGISSSANDLAKFLMWQLRAIDGKGDEVLKQGTFREMTRAHAVDTGSSMDVGYAFRTNYRGGKSYIGHGGVMTGHTSQTTIEPGAKLGAVTLMNTHDTSPLQINYVMMDVFGPVLKADNAPSQYDFSEYQGFYDNQPWGDESYIMQWGDNLISFYLSSSNPINAITKFRHLEGDKFIRLNDDGTEADVMTFLRNEVGKVMSYKDQSDYIYKKD